MNWVRVSKSEKSNLPLRPSTLYKWHHTKKHPEIFVKIGGSLFVDQDRFFELARAGKLASRG